MIKRHCGKEDGDDEKKVGSEVGTSEVLSELEADFILFCPHKGRVGECTKTVGGRGYDWESILTERERFMVWDESMELV